MNIYYLAAFALRLKQVTKRVVLWVTFCLHNFGPVVALEKRVAWSCSDCNFCPSGFFNFIHYWSRTLSDGSPSVSRARKGSLTGLSMKATLINLTKWPTVGSSCACFWPKKLHEGGTRASLPAEELALTQNTVYKWSSVSPLVHGTFPYNRRTHPMCLWAYLESLQPLVFLFNTPTTT